MTEKYCYIALCLFVCCIGYHLEACLAAIGENLSFYKDDLVDNEDGEVSSLISGSSKRNTRLNNKRCICKDNPSCLNDCNDDLIHIMLPEKKIKNVEEIIDDKSFEKPCGCTREYRYLRLSNSLNVFMVYDKSARISFGNMLLDFGFASDPENIPGLSRYLLYTILLGTLKKRFFKQFSTLTKKFKGGFGANINRDYSKYGFSIRSSEFEMALKIFAKMFINLNINDDVHKEILAELSNDLRCRLNTDSFRLSDVLYEIVKPRSTEGNSYDWNLTEYMYIHRLDKLKSKNLLLEFFNQYYRADRMTLTILSNKTLDEQTSMVRKYFNKIRRGDTNIVTRLRLPDSSMKHPLYGSTGKVLLFQSLKHSTLLKLIFPLENIIKPILSSKPMFFFSMYISSKRKGSLYYYFYKQELVKSMNVTLSNSIFGYYSLVVDVDLLNFSELNIVHIIQGIFSVFEMMRNTKPKLEIYNQAKSLKMKKFKHRSNDLLLNECSSIQDSFHCLKCPPEKVLSAGSIYTEYNLELHYKILSNLKPENMLLITTFRPNELVSLVEPTVSGSSNSSENSSNATESASNINPNSTQGEECMGAKGSSNSTCRTCQKGPGGLKGPSYNILLESNLDQSEIIVSNFTQTRYVIKKINHLLISNLTNSIGPFTAVNKFEIYDPDNKFLRMREPRDSLVGIQKQDVPIRLLDAIQNLRSRKYNKIITQDSLRDYQQFFYFPVHSLSSLKSTVSITISLPPNLQPDGLSFPYDPVKLEAIFSMMSSMLLRSFEDLKYYYSKLSIDLSFSMNTPIIYSFYTYGLVIELSGITDHLPHAITTIASRIKEFSAIAKNSDLNTSKEFYFKYKLLNSIENLPQFQFQSILQKLLYNQDLTHNAVRNEIAALKLEEVTDTIDFLVKNGSFEGIIYGNINPIKARELLLLFFINLGRNSASENSLEGSQNLFYRLFSLLRSLFVKCLSSLGNFITHFKGALPVETEALEHLMSRPTRNTTQHTLRDLQVIDILSFKPGSSFLYFEKSEYNIFAMNTMILKVCFGHFTVETESLVGVLFEVLSRKYQTELKAESNGILTLLRKSIFSDGVVSIEIKAISKNGLPDLIQYVLRIYNDWIVSYNNVTFEEFNTSKKTFIKSLENNPDYKSIFKFKEEIYLKRYNFDRRKEQTEFVSNLSYLNFLYWLSEQPKKAIKCLFVIYSPNSSEEELSTVLNSTSPDFELVNSTDYFFMQPNTKSFSPSQIYGLK
ncbi:signal peptide-containing secreted insulinase-like peptidase [Cryptosporidium canis]|uniref:Signal peptide-containing secreted insulinase-like peptidase n=1 Tax=Cryptosporidium canis TaxID=195482 RepID=A0ABQ8P436_9CRYT|nr:signal peptide-containing secreted insulinase-like peptidase [Cryptosporidium canis]KAJ1607534.1 signal peptide-containing secreted insulinase-like peptidase [Cryptosporidium canis]